MIRQEINVQLRQFVTWEFAEVTTGHENKQLNFNKLQGGYENKKGAAFLPMRHPFPTLGKNLGGALCPNTPRRLWMIRRAGESVGLKSKDFFWPAAAEAFVGPVDGIADGKYNSSDKSSGFGSFFNRSPAGCV